MLLQIPPNELLTYIIGAALLLSLIIILIFALAFYRLAGSKTEVKDDEREATQARTPVSQPRTKPRAFSLADITDEDMMVAALIATIDYAEETKKDVRLLSIRQIG